MDTPMYYLDFNATTPLAPEAKQWMFECIDQYHANPASVNHVPGQKANRFLEQCRETIAGFIHAPKESIYFTSGASESNNTVLKGVINHFLHRQDNQRDIHIITSAIEHKCILNSCEYLEHFYEGIANIEVSYIPVDSHGVIDVEALRVSIRPHTKLISIMAANNETGVLQPLNEIGSIARQHNILFHTDAAQLIGKMPFSVKNSNPDFVSFSAHKFYGPRGIGGLYCADNSLLLSHPLIHGGGQEQGLRSGTSNLPAIAGMAASAQLLKVDLPQIVVRQQSIKRAVIDLLQQSLPDIRFNGCLERSLPNTINFSISGVRATTLLNKLKKQVALSSGSACSTADQIPSHVLQAMGLDDENIQSSIRLSFGHDSILQNVSEAVQLIVDTARRLQVCA
jgi:cysteine desulfurase